jgi:hypothetical protein
MQQELSERGLVAPTADLAGSVAQFEAIAARPEVEAVTGAYARMGRELTSWGRWQLVLGVIHLIGASLLDGSWGVVLLLTGLASFVFRDASMFVVYGTTLTWAALANLSGSSGGWSFFAFVQLYFAYRIFNQFRWFRGVQARYRALAAEGAVPAPAAQERAAALFPWASCLLGTLALLGGLALIAGAALDPESAASVESGELVGVLGVVLAVSVLGFAAGLASLLSGFRDRAVSWIGVVVSGIGPLAFLAVSVLSRF